MPGYSQAILINGIDEQNSGPVSRSSLLNCTPVFSYDTPPPVETGIAGDGIFIWSGGATMAWYYKANSITGAIVDSIPKPVFPSSKGGDMDFDGTHLWTIIEQAGTLYQIDPVSGAIVNQLGLTNHGVISDPNHWGVACQGGDIWYTEYAIPTLASNQTLLFKITTSGMMIDSFLIPHIILPIKFINGDLWGIAFDVPYIFKFDLSTGLLIDSVPSCVSSGYGLTENDVGFWLCGVSSFNNNRIHLFNGIFSSVETLSSITSHVSLYPNPAKDFLIIETNENETLPIQVVIYNSVGMKVYEHQNSLPQEKITIDTRSFPRGFYMASFSGAFFPTAFKFILE